MYELLSKKSKTVTKSSHAAIKTTHSTAPIQMVNGDGFLRNKWVYRKDAAYQNLREEYRELRKYQEGASDYENRRTHFISNCRRYIVECGNDHEHNGRVQNVKDLLVKLGYVTRSLDDAGNTFHFGEDVVYGLDNGRRELVKYILGDNTEAFRFGMIQNNLTDAIWNTNMPTNQFSDGEIKAEILKKYPELKYDLDYVNRMVERISGFKTHLLGKAGNDAQGSYNVWREFSDGGDIRKEWKERWKRTSKAGLEYQLCKLKKDVYLAFDDLDIKEVIKVTPPWERPKHDDSITSGEVRWLYRHRDIPEVREHLKVYSLQQKALISLEEFFGETDRLDTPLARRNREYWDRYDQYREYRRQQRQNAQ